MRRVGHERVIAAVRLIQGSSEDDAGERIHQARKQLKRVRALLRLVRPNITRRRWDHAGRRLRNVSRALSAVRDATVLIHTLEGLGIGQGPGSDSLAALAGTARNRAVKARAAALADRRARGKLERRLMEAARLIDGWTAIRQGWKAIGTGLRIVYTDAHAAAAPLRDLAECGDLVLHEARKRAQTLLHVLEFLEAVRPSRIKEQTHALHELTELLGKDHDLAVLTVTLGAMTSVRLTAADSRRLNGAICSRRRILQNQAARLASQIYVTSAEEFVGQIHRYWKDWRRRARHGT